MIELHLSLSLTTKALHLSLIKQFLGRMGRLARVANLARWSDSARRLVAVHVETLLCNGLHSVLSELRLDHLLHASMSGVWPLLSSFGAHFARLNR